MTEPTVLDYIVTLRFADGREMLFPTEARDAVQAEEIAETYGPTYGPVPFAVEVRLRDDDDPKSLWSSRRSQPALR